MTSEEYREAIEKQHLALSSVVATSSTSSGIVPPHPNEQPPPSYEDSTKENVPGPPPPERPPEIPVLPPSVDATRPVVPVVAARNLPSTGHQLPEHLVVVPIGLTMIASEDRGLSYRRPVVWSGLFLVATGLDLAWSSIAFAYVLATALIALCTMVVPLVGIPVGFSFAITWRALARFELILSTSFYPTKHVLRPYVPPPVVFHPCMRDYIASLRLEGTQIRISRELPPAEDSLWATMRLTAHAMSTRRAVTYFIFKRLIYSLTVFVLFWVVFFPIWLIVGILCLGFAFRPGKLVWPVAGLLCRFPNMAIARLTEKTF